MLPGFEAVAWHGMVAPPKTPKDVVEKINADVNEALRQPEVKDHLIKLSAERGALSTRLPTICVKKWIDGPL